MAESTSEIARGSNLDLAFVIDCTGSMGSYIQHAKDNVNKIVDEIRKSEKCHVRVGLVEYRDHPPQDTTFITRVHQFNDDIVQVKAFISKCSACGGGDCPESVCCGLGDCLNKLDWRNDAVHIAILIADAPPHGLHGIGGDGFPNGCPDNNDPVKIANEMAEKAVTLYTAGCEPGIQSYRKFFMALSLITGGKYIPIDSADCLSDLIIGGSREEISMEALMAQIHNDVVKEAAEKGERVNEDELTKRIHDALNNRGAKINKLKVDGVEGLEITEEIKKMSQCKTLKEMNELMIELNITLNGLVPMFGFFSPSIGGGRGKVRTERPKKIPVPKSVAKKPVKKSTSKKSSVSSKKVKKEPTIGIRRSTRLALKHVPNEEDVDDEESSSEESNSEKSLDEKEKEDISLKETKTDETDVASSDKTKTDEVKEEIKKDTLENETEKQEGKDDGDETEPKSKRTKLEKKSSSINLSTDEAVTMDEARRLAKKSLARNKLN